MGPGSSHGCLQALHDRLFPIVYEREFYNKATLGLDGIASQAAFVRGVLVGFITYRASSALLCEDKVRVARGGKRTELV